MTSTPVSLNDESLNGSWIDINSASQIHSPMDDESAEFLMPPYSAHAESVQNLGLISFQVERFLQEAQRNSQQNLQQAIQDDRGGGGGGGAGVGVGIGQGNGDSSLLDQLSDSISLLSRASAIVSESGYDQQAKCNDDDPLWLWGWTTEPEYFAGQEWKIEANQHNNNHHHHHHHDDHITRRVRDRFRASTIRNSNSDTETFTASNSHMISWLLLTNILSIIIGAGLTYSILTMRKSSI